MPGMKIPDPFRDDRDKAVLTHQANPEPCLPYRFWQVGHKGGYNPYIIHPIRWPTTRARSDVSGRLRRHRRRVLEDKKYTLALNDQEGDDVVAELPATVEAWVRDGQPANRFCLIFLTDHFVSRILDLPGECRIRQPEDKWPLSAGGGRDART